MAVGREIKTERKKRGEAKGREAGDGMPQAVPTLTQRDFTKNFGAVDRDNLKPPG